MEFDFSKIEEEVKKFWDQENVYRVELDPSLPKYYVLDMFPYPSGAGLHVGHPLGYIASDIYARYKRLKGFNVLHPMGYDSFGLPAEQYAIQTGQHPKITTDKNIETFRAQMDKLGFSFDWSREVRTSDPGFYKWTQWIFIRLFHSWYNCKTDRAEPIESLILEFAQNGNAGVDAVSDQVSTFSAEEWSNFSAKQKSDILLNYRLAYIADSWVNWCPALGTVLANDEVKDGVSERGGYPVERKLMKQWSLRITAYAERLLQGLEKIDWSDSLKESQRNWIGKSEGCRVRFEVKGAGGTPLHRRGDGGEEDTLNVRKPGGYLTGEKSLGSILRDNARENRQAPTEAEEMLWQNIRNRKLEYKFRRQHPVANFIADFVCLQKKLIVELDGNDHKQNKEYDHERTRELERLGYKVIRFWNDEVLKNLSGVLSKIRDELKARPDLLTPDPSPEERGIDPSSPEKLFIEVFTTRPDTIFGATFITLAPEHELVEKITTPEYKKQLDEYVQYAKNRSERDRMADVKKVTGQFTGAFVEHPFSGKPIPVWVGEYVLATYGTGAVMGVPGHDERDHRFASHFGLPIVSILKDVDVTEKSFDDKQGILANSDFLNGLEVKDAISKTIDEIEKKGIGAGKVNYKLRDAIFGRQRYWGEPIPIYYDEASIPHTIEESDLPVLLPEVDKYLPTETGEPPLARAKDWKYKGKFDYEHTTMPGWAGSSWYYIRYGDPHNENEFASQKAINYWQNVDLYVGGDEHATGHLLYVRFWTKFLFDLGLIPFDEPAKKLVNQGKIQGMSALINRFWIGNRINSSKDISMDDMNSERPIIFLSSPAPQSQIDNLHAQYSGFEKKVYKIHVHIDLVEEKNNTLNIEKFRDSKEEYNNAQYILGQNGELFCERVVEKMSKRYGNVVNPNDVVHDYGADCFRLYEMFLGPIEQHKPWDTKGIDGCFRFLKKFWRLFYNEEGKWLMNNEEPTKDELKILHRTIKKVNDDIETMSFNTCVSAMMICVNELSQLDCHKRKILEPMLLLLSPFAPFISEKLWQQLGHKESIVKAKFPQHDESLLVETSFEYPVAVNGKTRVKMNFDLNLSNDQIEKEVISAEALQKYFEGKTPKKVIVVKGRMINVVV
ncbi:MAG: class I tRNA ligase family protein [Chitinophagales bacterium]|nr:class I tRNA ligase family protein [Chitinophagales bacterium]